MLRLTSIKLPALAFVLVLLPATFSAADPNIIPPPPHPSQAVDPEMEKNIRLLIELKGEAKVASRVSKMIFDKFAKTQPKVPKEFWDEAKRAANTREFSNLLVPIYARHFSSDEIKELIQFYQSPLGKRVAAETLPMMEDAKNVGSEWERYLAQQVIRRMKAKGYQVENPASASASAR